MKLRLSRSGGAAALRFGQQKRRSVYVVCICTVLGPVCGPYLDPGQGGHRGGQLHSGHRHPHRGGAGHELGHGVPHPGPGGHGGDQPPELALPHPIGAGHRGVLDVLLPGPAAWPGLSGGAHRQAQRGDHPGAGFVFLHEPFTAKSMVGCALIAAGTLFMVL